MRFSFIFTGFPCPYDNPMRFLFIFTGFPCPYDNPMKFLFIFTGFLCPYDNPMRFLFIFTGFPCPYDNPMRFLFIFTGFPCPYDNPMRFLFIFTGFPCPYDNPMRFFCHDSPDSSYLERFREKHRERLEGKYFIFPATGQWFSLGTPVSSTNKTDRHDITEILLRLALNTINQSKPSFLLLVQYTPSS